MTSRLDVRRWIEPIGVRKANNAGLVTIAAAGAGGQQLVHTLPISIITTAKIRKIIAYNITGAQTNLQFGYLTLAAAWVQVIPNLAMLNTFENVWNEVDLPNYEFRPDTTLVTGTLGDIWARVDVVAANNVTFIIEVEEFRQ